MIVIAEKKVLQNNTFFHFLFFGIFSGFAKRVKFNRKKKQKDPVQQKDCVITMRMNYG